jgi:hypothetical protein
MIELSFMVKYSGSMLMFPPVVSGPPPTLEVTVLSIIEIMYGTLILIFPPSASTEASVAMSCPAWPANSRTSDRCSRHPRSRSRRQ